MVTRTTFRLFNRFMVWLWRLGLGPVVNWCHPVIGRIMVLGTRGRRSGLRRFTPLNYAPGAGSVLCTAGFANTDWLLNVKADATVEVWLPDGRWQGRAFLEPDPDLEGMRQVLSHSGWAPRWLAGVNLSAGNEELREKCRDFQLVRIELTAREE